MKFQAFYNKDIEYSFFYNEPGYYIVKSNVYDEFIGIGINAHKQEIEELKKEFPETEIITYTPICHHIDFTIKNEEDALYGVVLFIPIEKFNEVIKEIKAIRPHALVLYIPQQMEFDERIPMRKFTFNPKYKVIIDNGRIGVNLPDQPVILMHSKPYEILNHFFSDFVYYRPIWTYSSDKTYYFSVKGTFLKNISPILGTFILFGSKILKNEINLDKYNKIENLAMTIMRPIDVVDFLLMASLWREKYENLEDIYNYSLHQFFKEFFKKLFEELKKQKFKTNPKIKVIFNKKYNSAIVSYPSDSKISIKIDANATYLLNLFKKGATIEDVFKKINEEYSIEYNNFILQIGELLKDHLLILNDNFEKEFNHREINSTYNLELVMYEITKKCNLRCIHCYNNSAPNIEEKHFSLNEFERSLEIFKSLGLTDVYLTGGEPLFREDIKEMILIIEKHNLWYHVFTNGILIDQQWIEFFREHKPKSIIISLDSIRDEEYRRIRGVSNKQLIKTIEELSKITDIRLNKVIFPEINDSKESIYEGFVYQLNTWHLNSVETIIDPVDPAGRGKKVNTLLNYQNLVKDINNIHKKVFGNIYYNTFSKKYSFCNVGISRLYVRNDGAITLCPLLNFDEHVIAHISDPEEKIKNVFETHPLLDYFRKRKYLNELCKSCDLMDYCVQGCVGKSYIMHGDYNHLDEYRCSVAKVSKSQGANFTDKPTFEKVI